MPYIYVHSVNSLTTHYIQHSCATIILFIFHIKHSHHSFLIEGELLAQGTNNLMSYPANGYLRAAHADTWVARATSITPPAIKRHGQPKVSRTRLSMQIRIQRILMAAAATNGRADGDKHVYMYHPVENTPPVRSQNFCSPTHIHRAATALGDGTPFGRASVRPYHLDVQARVTP